ncbi:hypothetical protein ACETU7_08010 [Rhodococcus sp. 3Y1]
MGSPRLVGDPTRIAGTQTPLELLARGQLTTKLVDNLTAIRRQAM